MHRFAKIDEKSRVDPVKGGIGQDEATDRTVLFEPDRRHEHLPSLVGD
jgi:hypothetical protein